MAEVSHEMTPLLFAIAIAATFGRALHGEFLFDDPAIKDFEPKLKSGAFLFRGKTPSTYWNVLMFAYYPRSLTHCVYTWIYEIAGYRTWAWHGFNLLLHFVNVQLFTALCGFFLMPERALLAAAIFAVHPHQSWVCYIQAMSGILSTTFALAGIFLALSGFWHVAILSHFLSCKAKQDGWVYLCAYPAFYVWSNS